VRAWVVARLYAGDAEAARVAIVVLCKRTLHLRFLRSQNYGNSAVVYRAGDKVTQHRHQWQVRFELFDLHCRRVLPARNRFQRRQHVLYKRTVCSLQ